MSYIVQDELDQTRSQQKRELLTRLLRQRAQTEFTVAPLSYGQRALWFLYQIDPRSAAYNLMSAARVRHDVDREALRRVLQGVMDRHAVLRTTYDNQQGSPVALVHGYREIQFQTIDATDWQDGRVDQEMQSRADEPFDLVHGPVMRVYLFEQRDSHVLLMTAHHIAMDFWSFDLLFDDLEQQYRAQTSNLPASSLPPVEVQYADYVRWQEQLLDGAEGDRLLGYWREKLGGDFPKLDIPTDRPRPAVQTFNGRSYHFQLPSGLSRQLLQLAKARATTPYTTLLTAFMALLYRYTGQTDMLVGSPTAGRNHARLEPIVGYFLNPVVVRSKPTDDLPFATFLAQVRDEVLESIANQDLPFPLLVERLMPPRDPSRSPIFNVAFAWDKPRHLYSNNTTPGTREDGDSLNLVPFALGQRGSAFDMMLMMLNQGETLRGAFQYNTDLFDEAMMDRFADQFQVLLTGIVATPEQRLAELPLLSAVEEDRLLRNWNATGADYPYDRCLHELFEAQVAQSPRAIAAISGVQQLTYKQLDERANQIAWQLRERGIQPDDFVGLCTDRSLDMLVGILGILKSGGAYVPFSPGTPPERLHAIVEDCGLRLVLTQSPMLAALSTTLTGVTVLDCHDVSITRENGNTLEHVAQPHHLAYVLFTSGSTGKPKGVELEHRSVVNFLTSMHKEPGIHQEDVLFAVTTPTFDISVLELLGPLLVGATVVIAPDDVVSDGYKLAAALDESGTSIMQATPATWRLLIESGWMGRGDLKILCGGEAMPRDLADLLLVRCDSLWNMYGPTETTIWSAVDQVSHESGPVSIGRPIANTRIYIVDQRGRPAPIGVPGDLHIGGDGLARGYLNRPELTAERFVPDPYHSEQGRRMYRTGDVARYRADGRIEFLGRHDSQVKIRGYRIELGEIEYHLNQHDGVRQAVVVAKQRGDADDDKHLVAYILPESTASGSSELRDYLATKLPVYMLPAVFMTLDEFPLNSAGKVDRRALPEPEAIRPDVKSSFVAPRDQNEVALADVWGEVLELDRIGVHDNFFELGGASIQSLQVSERAAAAGLQLTPTMLFQHPTVAELAAAATRQDDMAVDSSSSDLLDAVTTSHPMTPPSKVKELRPTHESNGKSKTDYPNVIIESLGVYLPPNEVSTADVLKGCKNRTWFPLESMTGIKTRRMAGDTEFSIDLAQKAVEECLSHSRYGTDDIDLLVCCNIARIDAAMQQSMEPNTSLQLKKLFGFKNAQVFDISNACAGMFTAVHLIETFINAGVARRGMVVSGEYITAITRTAQLEISGFLDPRLPCLTVGDAGAAAIIEAAPDDRCGFHELELFTLSKYSRMCIGGLTDQPHGGAIMHVPDPMKHTAVAVKHSVDQAGSLFQRSPWLPDQMQHLIMHQTSERSLRDGMQAINKAFGRNTCTSENTINNLARRGNTATTTHFVALWDNMRSGRIKSHDNVLFGITGSGQTIGTGIYTFDDLPDRLREPRANGPSTDKRGHRQAARPAPVAKPSVRVHSIGTLPLDHDIPCETMDLCVAAAETCLANAEFDRGQIELLLFTGMLRTRYICEPAIASLVAEQLKMNVIIESEQDPKTLAFDIFAGALGFLYGCQVATHMIQTGKIRTAMIIGSEVEVNRAYGGSDLGVQQTASAMILETASGEAQGFGQFVFKYFPQHMNARMTAVSYRDGRPDCNLRRSEDLENLYLKLIPNAVQDVLQCEGLTMSRIDVVLPPQLSPHFNIRLAEILGVTAERVVKCAESHADLFTSAVPYSFEKAKQVTGVKPGAIGLIINVGSGIQVGCGVYRFD